MRDRFDQGLLLAMVLAEAVRSGIDIWHFVRWFRVKTEKWRQHRAETMRPSLRGLSGRSLDYAALAVVCTLAIVPTVYYGAHAIIS